MRTRERTGSAQLGARFRRALVYAARIHAKQFRKGTTRPYIAHLLGVTSIVLTHGGHEDEAIAALLHDAVEDQGGMACLRDSYAFFPTWLSQQTPVAGLQIGNFITPLFGEPNQTPKPSSGSFLSSIG
jgi:HD domain